MAPLRPVLLGGRLRIERCDEQKKAPAYEIAEMDYCLGASLE